MAPSKLVQTVSRAAKLAKIAHTARKTARGSEQDRAAAKRALANLLADARGVPMKIGQFLATSPGYEDLQTLVEGIEPRPLSQMLPVLEQGLGRPADAVFTQIDESQAAASLGQVHHGVLLDGTQVAVKLRYPDIHDAVDAEMRLAGLMPGAGPVKQWGFDLGAYKTTLKANMDRELNYLDEAQRQLSFGQQIQVPGLVVPQVYSDLCSEGVLVQSWESGLSLKDTADWPHAQRLAIGSILMQTLFAGLFVGGQVHGDPHLGNMFVRRDASDGPQLVLLDYGCTIPIDQQSRMALLKLIVGCHDRDQTDPMRCLVAMGFDAAKLVSIADALPALCAILFEPFVGDDPFSTKYWDVGRRTSALLGELKWWFRAAGPARLMLLMRGFNGLVHHLHVLKVMQPWWQMLVQTVGPAMINQARAYEPPPLPCHIARHAQTYHAIAQYLKVRVTEAGRQVVAVTLPASQTPFIREQMTPQVLASVEEQGIDLDRLVRDCCARGIVPGELFSLDVGDRHYQIWLE